MLTRPLAELKRPLVREGAQFPLGALIADARRNALRADLGLVRTESIRADLPAGPVTYARLSAVEPARSDLVRLTLTGAQLSRAAGAGARRVGRADGAPGRRARCATIRARAPGKRIRGVVLAGGRKVRPDAEYTLATDEATAGGAGGLSPLRGPAVRAGRPARRRGGGRVPPPPAPAGRGLGARRLRLHPTRERGHAGLRERHPDRRRRGHRRARVRSGRTTRRSRRAPPPAPRSSPTPAASSCRSTAPLAAGSILRVVVRARRPAQDRRC